MTDSFEYYETVGYEILGYNIDLEDGKMTMECIVTVRQPVENIEVTIEL